MYGEYYVTKFFTNADDIRLRMNSLLIYTTLQRMARTTEKKMERVKQTQCIVGLCTVVYHFLFFFFLPFNFLITLLDSPVFFTLYS